MLTASRPSRVLVLILALTLGGQGWGIGHSGSGHHDDAHASAAPTLATDGELPDCHGHDAQQPDSDPDTREACEHGSCDVCFCAGFQLPHLVSAPAVTCAPLTDARAAVLRTGRSAPPVERLFRPPII